MRYFVDEARRLVRTVDGSVAHIDPTVWQEVTEAQYIAFRAETAAKFKPKKLRELRQKAPTL